MDDNHEDINDEADDDELEVGADHGGHPGVVREVIRDGGEQQESHQELDKDSEHNKLKP